MSRTTIALNGQRFLLNGRPTHPGTRCEGLLMNTRMVQATFDDLNPETRHRWRMPDGSEFDADANTARFCAMLPTYKAHGIDAVTVNMQGGSPQGYSKDQPWENSAYDADGSLREAYRERMGRVLDAADAAGIAVILGLFYFGQDERLRDEAAVERAVDGTVDWLMERGDRHVMIEIANECDIDRHDFPGNFHYEHETLRPEPRGGELIRRVQERSGGKGGGLLCSTSYSGGGRLTPSVAEAADFILLHGNAVESTAELLQMIADSREVAGYRGQPIVINEDDHFQFAPGHEDNRLEAAINDGVGWGYFDYRFEGEPFEAGFQSVPTDWTISHPRKRAFFDALKRLTERA